MRRGGDAQLVRNPQTEPDGSPLGSVVSAVTYTVSPTTITSSGRNGITWDQSEEQTFGVPAQPALPAASWASTYQWPGVEHDASPQTWLDV